MNNEQERAAYMAGDTRTADLLARMYELEDAAREVVVALEDMAVRPSHYANLKGL